MLKLVLSVVGVMALAAVLYDRLWERSAYSEVLNIGQPTTHAPSEKLAEELKRASLELKSRSYNPGSNQIDYKAVSGSDQFKQFVKLSRSLRNFNLSDLTTHGQKLAFWINLYNALTIQAVIAYQPKHSVRDVRYFFDRAAYDIGGYRFSLNDIENGILRANRPAPYQGRKPFGAADLRKPFALTAEEFDPRIHFALNCGSRSCPPIAFYDPTHIDEQLDTAARGFIQSQTSVHGNKLVVSSIFKWYRKDFGGDIKGFIAKYLSPEVRAQLEDKRIVFSPYDWSLNQ